MAKKFSRESDSVFVAAADTDDSSQEEEEKVWKKLFDLFAEPVTPTSWERDTQNEKVETVDIEVNEGLGSLMLGYTQQWKPDS